jgi:hypothetical protein
MAIRALSLQEFDRFNAARATVARHTDKAVEWFADDAGAVLGAIAYDHFDLEWSVVVLGRDDHGQFRALDRDGGMHVLDDARRILVEKMALATDQLPSIRPAAAHAVWRYTTFL